MLKVGNSECDATIDYIARSFDEMKAELQKVSTVRINYIARSFNDYESRIKKLLNEIDKLNKKCTELKQERKRL